MDPTTASSPPSQQASPFGAATLKKAVNVLAHYVDFSDASSSWSGSQSDRDGAETPDNAELRTPLLQSQAAEPDQVVADSGHVEHLAEIEVQKSAPTAAKVSPVSEQAQTPTDEDVQSPHRNVGRATSSNDGAQTPTKEDVRTPLLQSQPVDHGTVSPAQSESPRVPPSGGLENLGSGLLNPSLLEQLLDEHAPPPDMPYGPIRHVVPVNAPDHPGDHSRILLLSSLCINFQIVAATFVT